MFWKIPSVRHIAARRRDKKVQEEAPEKPETVAIVSFWICSRTKAVKTQKCLTIPQAVSLCINFCVAPLSD